MAEKRWFEPIDPGFSGKYRAEILETFQKQHEDCEEVLGEDIPLGAEDLALLREYAKDQALEVRLIAIRILGDEADDLSWEELEEWALDSDEEVRGRAMFMMELSYSTVGQLCNVDKQRCVSLLVKVAETYEDVSIAFWSLAGKSAEWLDLTWDAVGRLIDLERENITSALCAGYVEDVLRYKKLGPDDPRVKFWIDSDKSERKFVLLGVVEWLGFEQDNLREITEALSRDADPEVAEFANELIEREKASGQSEQKKGRKPGKPRWSESEKKNRQEN